MQVYNVLPDPDGSWKAVLVAEDELVIGHTDKDKLISTLERWAQKTGEPISLRIFNDQGDLMEERLLQGEAE